MTVDAHVVSSGRQILSGDKWSAVEWEPDATEGRIIQVTIPLPFSLRWVNAYMLQDGAAWTVIDPGLNTELAQGVWDQVLAGLQLDYSCITRIVLTHYHPDHLGLAGWMQQRSGASVYLSEVGKQHMEMLWGEGQRMTNAMAALYREHGVPELLLDQLKEHMESFVPLVHPLPAVTLMRDGDILLMGNRVWKAIETSGHAPGHISFYCEAHQLLMAGDHLLPQITPNVSLMPSSDPDPLYHFIKGLDKLAELNVGLAFPGHRHPLQHAASRIEGIKQHHEERLAAWLQWLVEEQATAYAICSRAFGTVGKLTVHQFRFAMGETLAHLRELERRGVALRREVHGVVSWAAK